MMDEMSAPLFLDWAEFDRVCLLGEERIDTRLAALAWLVDVHTFYLCKAHGAKGGHIPRLDDFVYDPDKTIGAAKQTQSPEEMIAKLRTVARLHNAFIAQGKG
jgi:hypothetical protein